jgi:hypothetical protein
MSGRDRRMQRKKRKPGGQGLQGVSGTIPGYEKCDIMNENVCNCVKLAQEVIAIKMLQYCGFVQSH